MIFGDNQTRHCYVVAGSAGVAKKTAPNNTDMFRLNIHEGGNAASTASNVTATTDVVNKKLVKNITVSDVKPTYFHKWTVSALTGVTANTTYYVYFYLENLLGFGVQDRFDRVASYTTNADDTAATTMAALKADLEDKLNAGPIKGDFTVALSTNDIIVTENPNGPSFKGGINELDLRMHTNPYAYNVTMSTGKTTGGAIEAWTSNQKEIKATDDTSHTYISSATKVKAMELYFMRNRGDLYDLNPDFKTAILNPSYVDLSKDYACVDVHYAFSDELGFTYHSDKDMTIATCGTAANVPAFSTETTYVGGEPVTYDSKYYIMKAHSAGAWSATDATEVSLAYADAIQIAELFK